MLITEKVFDLVFPKYCLGCGREGEWLCRSCRLFLRPKTDYRCPICRRLQPNCRTCFNCRKNSWLDGLWVLADYRQPLVAEIIKAVKYYYARDVLEVFNQVIIDYFSRVSGWKKSFWLVPVPLARRRFLNRGFNQAELIARSISQLVGNPLKSDFFKRKSGRPPQVSLSSVERRKNVQGVFQFNEKTPKSFRPPVVLVDDVYTTGATLQESAKVLRINGFSKVFGVVLARN